MKRVVIEAKKISPSSASKMEAVFYLTIFDEDVIIVPQKKIIIMHYKKDKLDILKNKLLREIKKDWDNHEAEIGILNSDAMANMISETQSEAEDYINEMVNNSEVPSIEDNKKNNE